MNQSHGVGIYTKSFIYFFLQNEARIIDGAIPNDFIVSAKQGPAIQKKKRKKKQSATCTSIVSRVAYDVPGMSVSTRSIMRRAFGRLAQKTRALPR